MMARNLLRIRRGGGAVRWLRDLGRRIGRLEGSLRHWVLLL